jgi:hypothetical protein
MRKIISNTTFCGGLAKSKGSNKIQIEYPTFLELVMIIKSAHVLDSQLEYLGSPNSS